jgi:hypothetical protein
MTETRRLLDDGTEFEREILASARLDAGSERGRRRAAIAMSAAVVSATTATATSAVGATAGAGLGAMSTGVAVKWVGIAVVALSVAGASARVASKVPSARSPAAPASSVQNGAPSAPVATPPLAPAAMPPAAQAATPPPAVPPDSTPVVVATSTQPAPAHPRPVTPLVASAMAPPAQPPAEEIVATSPPTEPDVRAPDVRAEVSALGEARSALTRFDARKALERLEAYSREFPDGLLADEATILRIDALVQQREHAAAAALSRRYLDAHPRSPYATHLRSVIHESQNE